MRQSFEPLKMCSAFAETLRLKKGLTEAQSVKIQYFYNKEYID